MKNEELRTISARLDNLCIVMEFIAKAANENIYGNMFFHMADSPSRISDDFSDLLDDMSASNKSK